MIAHTSKHTAVAMDYERIARAIQFLNTNWQRRPNLDDVAKYAGLSKYHFQRLFSRWAGISPKQYIQFLTIRSAKRLLANNRPLLNVSEELSLSGPSRLHDLFVSLDAVTPGEFKRQGKNLTIRYGVHPSPFGSSVIGLTRRGICFLGFTDDTRPKSAESLIHSRWPAATLVPRSPDTSPYARHIFTLAQRKQPFPLPVQLCGTNFQVKVWEALMRIPEGHTTTYQDIATVIGHPSAVRAVGHAVASNPIGFLIPCHRVLCKNGTPGGYAWGLSRKHTILCCEGARKEAFEAHT